MLAPSYQIYEKVSEPYTKKGKMYIDIKHPSTGNVRSARWYTETEYAKAYGGAAKPKTAEINFKQKHCLGFDNGPITIFKGVNVNNEEYFSCGNARYCVHWGWYLPSEAAIPADLPNGVTAIPLSWELVGDGDNLIENKNRLHAIINKLVKEYTA